jgi:hypothetical protein
MSVSRDLALDPSTYDLLIQGQDLAPLVADTDAIVSAVVAVTKCVAGEWFLDQLNTGIPWLTIFRTKGVSVAGIQKILFDKYASIPGVQQVNQVIVTLNRQARTCAVTWTLTASAQLLTQTTPVTLT